MNFKVEDKFKSLSDLFSADIARVFSDGDRWVGFIIENEKCLKVGMCHYN